MAQVILPVTALLALILLHSTVLARQGLMFSTGSHSHSAPAMSVEDGPNYYSSSQAKHQESVGLRSEQTSPQSSRVESPSSARKRKDAAEEIVNLLHKDYFHKPSGKPPIHNRFTRH